MSSLLGVNDPLITPYCARCSLPVERLSFRRQQDRWSWSFEAQCCGATRGHRLSMSEILRITTTGEKFWAVEKKAGGAHIAKMANLGRG